jgi:hypothetical protein
VRQESDISGAVWVAIFKREKLSAPSDEALGARI